MLLERLLKELVHVGTLTVTDADGGPHVFRGAEGPAVAIRLHDRALHHKLYLSPSMAAGEAYMNGTLTIEEGTLYDFLDLVSLNAEPSGVSTVHRLRNRLRLLFRIFQQINPVPRARTHVAHHYDLSGALYDLFLDEDRQYSCAYFLNENDSLEKAQDNKCRHIAKKLLLEPNQKVLDIGSGWGGLALHLAKETGVEVTGLTLSTEQLAVSRERAKKAGLSDRVRFHLRDYREEFGTYDRIVSVGMFEHVGVRYYPAFFNKVRDLLVPDGVALLHTIGRADGPGTTDPWICKYIFPGGYIPALSEVASAVEKASLYVADVEVLRLHYAETLRHWRERFLANRKQAAALYDERFCRMWEFYLAASEASFRHLDNLVYQVQFTKTQTAVPWTRDYIYGPKDGKSAPFAGGRRRAA